MSLSFDFPNWKVGIGTTHNEQSEHSKQPVREEWEADLQELSESDDSEPRDSGAEKLSLKPPEQQLSNSAATSAACPPAKRLRASADHARTAGEPGSMSPCKTPEAAAAAEVDEATAAIRGAAVPDAVLLLLASHLSLADTASLACCCKAFYDFVATAGHAWQQRHEELLGRGWPWTPFVGAQPAALPASLGGTCQLKLKTTLAASKVCLRLYVMRKGYEFLLQGFEALWTATAQQHSSSSAAAATVAANMDVSAAAAEVASPAEFETEHLSQSLGEQQQQQYMRGSPGSTHPVDERYSGRQLQRIVAKLSAHSWQLLYEGYTVALTARTDEIAATLKTWWQLQQEEEHAGAAVDVAAAGAAQAADPAAVLADCAGGILCAVESVSGGRSAAGGLLAAEPEVLLAATCRGTRPSAGIQLWLQLLTFWDIYKRWLDLVVTRCGLLGARVAVARQLDEPPPLGSSASGSAGSMVASSVPHLRNKGLMLFRSQVLLCYKLRRPLQQAALWLAATASADAATWRAGGGLSDADIDCLTRVRKLLRELDVGDDGSEARCMHTHAKFRRCFGALLTKERRGLVSSYWMG